MTNPVILYLRARIATLQQEQPQSPNARICLQAAIQELERCIQQAEAA